MVIGERRLNTWIDTRAALALERLATRDGVTLRVVIERPVILEYVRVLTGLGEYDSPEWERYFERQVPPRPERKQRRKQTPVTV